MKKMKICLWLGLAGAILGTLGELLGGLAPATDLTNRMTVLFSSLMGVPAWRVGLCTSLGAFGILLQYFGYYGILLSFEDRENGRGWVYYIANWGYTVVGAIYHVLCCCLIFLMQLLQGTPGFREAVLRYLIWFLAPMGILFVFSCLLVCGILFFQMAGGHSSFPRWCCLLNPLLLSLLLNGLLFFLPSSAIVNGLSFAGLGIASCLIFAVLLMACPGRHR